jgi:hypothetical protein
MRQRKFTATKTAGDERQIEGRQGDAIEMICAKREGEYRSIQHKTPH